MHDSLVSDTESPCQDTLDARHLADIRMGCLMQARAFGGTEDEVLARAGRFAAYVTGSTEDGGAR